MNKTEVSESSIYKEEIEPIIRRLKEVCKSNGYPFFLTVCINPKEVAEMADSDKMSEYIAEYYENDFLSPYQCNTQLNPDYIAECIKVINGFHVVSTTMTTDDAADFIIQD